MARQTKRIGWKDHRPRGICNARRPPVKLAIDEICKPPEQHAQRHVDRNIVAYAQPIKLVAPRHKSDRDQNAKHAAVKAHPAIPHSQDFPAHKALAFETDEQFGLVKQDITQPAAKDDAKRAIEKQIVSMALRHR